VLAAVARRVAESPGDRWAWRQLRYLAWAPNIERGGELGNTVIDELSKAMRE
jgi:hypothetical protein